MLSPSEVTITTLTINSLATKLLPHSGGMHAYRYHFGRVDPYGVDVYSLTEV